MNKNLLKMFSYFFKNRQMLRRWHHMLVFMSAVVVFVVTYMLILPAITMEKQPVCGMEEHTHTDECYEEITELICGIEEGEEHTHGEECYASERVLICGMEEHTHTEECYAQAEETEATTLTLTEEEASQETSQEDVTAEETREEKTPEEMGYIPDTYAGRSAPDEEYSDTENMGYAEDEYVDISISGSSIFAPADNTVSGPALEGVTSEGYSEASVEKYTETTTQAPVGQDFVVYSSSITGNGSVNWTLSPSANGGYTLAITLGEGTEIPSDLFNAEELAPYKTLIDRVEISNGITSIADNAFKDCTSLRTVVFEPDNSLNHIGMGAFSGCTELNSINLEDCKNLVYLGCSTNMSSSDFTELTSGVFYGTALTEVTIPASAVYIGSFAFYSCKSLTKVNVEEHTSAATLGAYMFGQCTALESINLDGFAAEGNSFCTDSNNAAKVSNSSNGMFYNCTSLKELTLPPVASGTNLSYLCYSCSSLASICFDKATELTGANNQLQKAFYYCYSLKVLDFSALTNITKMFGLGTDDAGCLGSVETLILPYTVTSFENKFIKNTSITEIVFTKQDGKATPLNIGEDTRFSDATKLKELELTLASGTKIGGWTFSECKSLEKLTLNCDGTITNLGQKFVNARDYVLNEIVYNIKTLTGVDDNAFTNFAEGDDIKLTIGKDVDTVPSKFFNLINGKIANFEFAPDNVFTITETSGYGVMGFPFSNGFGTYVSDSNGNLYFINNNNNIATLVYASRNGSGTFTVPETISFTDNDGTAHTATVRFIGSDAFNGCYYDSIVFDNSLNISTLSDSAFAGCYNLSSINGYTTESEIKANVFPYILEDSYGTNLYTSTQIEEKVFSAAAKTDTEWMRNKALLLTISNTTASTAPDITGIGHYATGETANIKATLSDDNTGDVYRVYFKYTDECTYTPEIYDDKNNKIVVKQCEEDGIPISGLYYYELSVPTSGTALNTDLTFSYVNGTAPGNKVYVWSVRGTNGAFGELGSGVIEPGVTQDYTITATDAEGNSTTTAQAIGSGSYLELVWETAADTFSISKESASTPVFKADSVDNKTVYVENVGFKVSFGRVTNYHSNNTGKDYVKYAELEDAMTLPDNLSWISGLTAKTETRYSINSDGKSGSLYATIGNEEVLVCTISLVSEKISEISLGSYTPVNEDGTEGTPLLSIRYKVENDSLDSEIDTAMTTITFGPRVIIADSVNEGEFFDDIKNIIKGDMYYQFSPVQKVEASAGVQLSPGYAALSYGKECIDNAEYMGENVVYKITVDNHTALPYEGKVSLYDDLSDHGNNATQYITADNIEAMFTDAANAYDKENLTVKITNAAIVAPVTGNSVTAVDGTSIGYTSAENSAKYEQYNGLYKENDSDLIANDGVITIAIKDGKLTASLTSASNLSLNSDYIVGEGNYGSLDEAFKAMSYIVTPGDKYLVSWVFDTKTYNPNFHKEYELTATVKNTFMYEKEDQLYYWGFPQPENKQYVKNSLYTSESDYSNGTNAVAATNNNGTRVGHDLQLTKQVSDSSGELSTDFTIYTDNTLLDYKINVSHFGEGTFDLLPVVDSMTGVQVLLAPVDGNEGAAWIADTDGQYEAADGTKYYILNGGNTETGTPYVYKNVWLGGSGYADSITVTKTADGLDTLIKWYYMDTYASPWELHPTYKALVSQDYAGNANTVATYNLANQVWLNDHPTHRLWYRIAGGGSNIKAEKKIVADPTGGTLDDKSTISKDNNTVTYRLAFNCNGQASFDHKALYDKLPDTGGAFDWEKGVNVTLSYGVSDENNITVTGGDNWSITDINPDDTVSAEPVAGQYYIVWTDGFKVDYTNSGGDAYIYVTLTFTEDNEKWDNFVSLRGSSTLYNTLYMYDLPHSVSHNIIEPGEVMLRKGVYETGYFIKEATRNRRANTTSAHRAWIYAYYRGSDRDHYIITPDDDLEKDNLVYYYIVLENNGITNLYLSPVYDVLPKGFEFFTMCSTTDEVGKRDGSPGRWKEITVHGGSKYIAKPGDGAALAGANGDFTAKVTVDYDSVTELPIVDTVKEDVDRVKFNIKTTHSDATVPKDSDGYDEMPFLAPNEALQFGYACYTGPYELAPAENYCAMEYYDVGRAGVKVYDGSVTVSTANSLNANDGDIRIVDNDIARSLGFTEVNENNPAAVDINTGAIDDTKREWLISQVNLTTDKIVPGILKEAEQESYNYNDPVKWIINAYNSGVDTMRNYTLEDTVDYPYVFDGDVTYSIYSKNAPVVSNGYDYSAKGDKIDSSYEMLRAASSNKRTLFTISNRATANGETTVTLTSNTGSTASLTIGGGEVLLKTKLSQKDGSYNENEIYVSIDKDGVGAANERLKIRFADSSWGIPGDCWGRLTACTVRNPQLQTAGEYTNVANVVPVQQTWSADRVSNGTPVTSGTTKYVTANAYISTVTGNKTTAYTAVEETKADGTLAQAVSNSAEENGNRIVLQNPYSTFRYTLNVTNSAESVMDTLVLIDNLPQVGDHSTLNVNRLRNSEFEVRLTDTPDFKVKYTITNSEGITEEKELTEVTDYTIGFSAETDNYTDDDWHGVTGENTAWSSTADSSTRSFRVVITADIPESANVQVSFNAQAATPATVESGQIAWNSFGYQFQNTDSTAWTYAAPLSVGVQAQSTLYINKALVNSKGDEVAAEGDYTFEFVIYTLNTDKSTSDIYWERGGYNEYGIKNSAAAFKELTFISVTVPKGGNIKKEFVDIFSDNQLPKYTIGVVSGGSSGFVESSEKWTWEEGVTYYVTELGSSAPYSNAIANTPYSFGYLNGDSADTRRTFQFTYDPYTNTEVTFDNVRSNWKIALSKYGRDNIPDNSETYNPAADTTLTNNMPNAVFGLYSPYSDNRLSSIDIATAMSTYGISVDISDIITDGAVDYYLTEILTTDNDGELTFEGLSADNYLVKELKAPDGYAIEGDNYYLCSYSEHDDSFTVGQVVYNVKSVDMPETGGIGNKTIELIGAALTAAAAMLILLKRRKGLA